MGDVTGQRGVIVKREVQQGNEGATGEVWLHRLLREGLVGTVT